MSTGTDDTAPAEPGDPVALTGTDYCFACQEVVTWRRHLDDDRQVVHDVCSSQLVPYRAGNFAHARAMSTYQASCTHQLFDAQGDPPQISGVPGRFEITLDLPISCQHCDTSSDDLVAELDDGDHDIEIIGDRLRVYPVVESMPAHLTPEALT